jgi:hypothetical protein
MNYQKLATITPNRHFMHEQGKTVYLCWDDDRFCLSRAQLSQFARALEHGSRYLYAESGHYSVVHVDDDVREIWMGTEFITLSANDYRALLNAALTTETRLHGFRDASPDSSEFTYYHPLRATGFSWN